MQGENNRQLKDIIFPGRGVVIGTASDGKLFCAYFITGRTDLSKKKRLRSESAGVISVEPTALVPVTDDNHESLFYNAIIHHDNIVAVGSGKHTDTIFALSSQGTQSLEYITSQWSYEQTPEHAPRIGGRILLPGDRRSHHEGSLIIIREGDTQIVREEYGLDYPPTEGLAKCFVTYSGLGSPMPVGFEGAPLDLIIDSADSNELCEEIGGMLNPEFRVGVAVMMFARCADSQRVSSISHILNYTN